MQSDYDQMCREAKESMENQLIDHFENQKVVFSIYDGCSGCQCTKSNLYCERCKVATFCSQACLQVGWKQHKQECFVLCSLQEVSSITDVLPKLGWREAGFQPKPLTTLPSIAALQKLHLLQAPHWFSDIDYTNPNVSKQYLKTIIQLFSLLRSDATTVQDKSTFPPSIYPFSKQHATVFVHRAKRVDEFIKLQGHLTLLSIWMQHPQPPAVQSIPFEQRSFFQILDSILQIEEINQSITNYFS